MTIDTTTYQAHHGKTPKGRGHWAFGTKRQTELDDMIWSTGLYADARKEAAAIARKRFPGTTTLYVQP